MAPVVTRNLGVPQGRLGPHARRDFALFAWLPALLSCGLLAFLAGHHQLAFDFSREYWVAGRRLLHGGAVYSWSRAQLASDTAYPYPAAATLVFVPFALLPRTLGAVLFTAGCIACPAAALRVLGVRDWRLYGIVALWAPVVAGWQSANLTLPLVLALALVWRHRDRPLVAGLLAAAIISLKPFLWPVALWLLATRRHRAAAACAAAALLVSAAAWAVAGFSQIGAYLKLDGRVTSAHYDVSYGLLAVAHRLGASRGAGAVLMVVAAASLAAVCLRLGRRDEGAAVAVCVAVALAASPLVDTHYFALLLVPLAIRRPRLGVEWVVPLALWLCPETATAAWQPFVAWAAALAVVHRLAQDRAPGAVAAAPGRVRRPCARSPSTTP
jgi:Glycosyltransferase family 87